MRRLIVTAALALAAFVAFSVPALAHGGERHRDRGHDRGHDRVCVLFVVKGTVDEVQPRGLALTVHYGWPEDLVGDKVQLGTGSRTHVWGTPAPGSVVKAHGVVCQLDDADAPVFYTMLVKVKRERVKPQKGTRFDLIGEVKAVGDDAVEVGVTDANVPGLAGTTVRLLLGGAEVQGVLEPGALVSAEGLMRGSSLHASLVVVERGPEGGGDEVVDE
jgi:hypothetical protein